MSHLAIDHPVKPDLGRLVALPHAQRLCELLRPVCVHVEIAGSVRRQKDTVSDMEIVALPLPGGGMSLFEEPPATYTVCEEFKTLLRQLQGSAITECSVKVAIRRDGTKRTLGDARWVRKTPTEYVAGPWTGMLSGRPRPATREAFRR